MGMMLQYKMTDTDKSCRMQQEATNCGAENARILLHDLRIMKITTRKAEIMTICRDSIHKGLQNRENAKFLKC